MQSFGTGGCAVVVGASGGIGAALVDALLAEPAFDAVYALARRPAPDEAGKLRHVPADITDEASVAGAARRVSGKLRLAIVATGILHRAGGVQPEKTYRALDPAVLLEFFRINTVGPALVAKHLLPLMPSRGRCVFAALSARVGSIGDNRAGGWHGYRASKAALNMMIRNLAIETARRNPECICVGLHPGTVETGLSRPFQGNVLPGKLFTPAFAVERLLRVIDALEPRDSGSVLAWDGSAVPP